MGELSVEMQAKLNQIKQFNDNKTSHNPITKDASIFKTAAAAMSEEEINNCFQTFDTSQDNTLDDAEIKKMCETMANETDETKKTMFGKFLTGVINVFNASKTENKDTNAQKSVTVDAWGTGPNDCLYNIVKNNYPGISENQIESIINKIVADKNNNLKDKNTIIHPKDIIYLPTKNDNAQSTESTDAERQALIGKLLQGSDADKYSKYATKEDLKALIGTDEAKKKEAFDNIKYRNNVIEELRKNDPSITDDMVSRIAEDIQSGKIAVKDVNGDDFRKELADKISELKKDPAAAKNDQSKTDTNLDETEKLRNDVLGALDKFNKAGGMYYYLNNLNSNVYLANKEDLQKIYDTIKSITKGELKNPTGIAKEKVDTLQEISNKLSNMNETLYDAAKKGWFSSADITSDQKATLTKKIQSGEIVDNEELNEEIKKLKSETEVAKKKKEEEDRKKQEAEDQKSILS
ncbi:MAG: hypothetical protein PHC34_12130 [Candidatus Gastranaerophilales bacterium]|nr:hypothetical protein [Candidatus Gastranaerophilales bacterium]